MNRLVFELSASDTCVSISEWGSGGRWFESSRPDIRKASRDNMFRLAFFASWGLVPTPGAELRVEIQPFRTTQYPSSAA